MLLLANYLTALSLIDQKISTINRPVVNWGQTQFTTNQKVEALERLNRQFQVAQIMGSFKGVARPKDNLQIVSVAPRYPIEVI
ncbi:MAG: hypothetical protein ACI93R_001894 [Flavobacteriales bacterium]|jgi:hypothetical protein